MEGSFEVQADIHFFCCGFIFTFMNFRILFHTFNQTSLCHFLNGSVTNLLKDMQGFVVLF